MLDIDGVINMTESTITPFRENGGPNGEALAKYRIERREKGETAGVVLMQFPCQSAIDSLNEILKVSGAKIVLSSTWRYDSYDMEYWKKFMEAEGIIGEVIDITPRSRQVEPWVALAETDDHYSGVVRGHEIKQWLVTEGIKRDVYSYVIFDDDSDMLFEQLPFFILVSRATGIDEDDVYLAETILETEWNREASLGDKSNG